MNESIRDFLKKGRLELEDSGKLYLKIKVLPKANKTEFRDLMSDKTLKVAIQAPPTDGKANRVLEIFLRKNFFASEVKIISGQKERMKLVKLVYVE